MRWHGDVREKMHMQFLHDFVICIKKGLRPRSLDDSVIGGQYFGFNGLYASGIGSALIAALLTGSAYLCFDVLRS